MRAILVDWLVQVHSKFRLLQETLYMCVAIMDRFLQVRDFVQLSELCIYALPRCGASEEKTKSQFMRCPRTSSARKGSSPSVSNLW